MATMLSAARSLFTLGDGAKSLRFAAQQPGLPRGGASIGGSRRLVIRCSRSKSSSSWTTRRKDGEDAPKSREKRELVYPRKGKVVRNKALVLELARGFRGKKVHRVARARVAKALEHSHRDRRNRKRDFRKLWIARIGAAARLHGLSYQEFIYGLNRQKVELNRKLLANMGILDPESFKRLTDSVLSTKREPQPT